jgi:hypothetical protein
LGSLAGLSATEVERLATPDGCGGEACSWSTPGGRTIIFVADARGLPRACAAGAIVLSRIPAPPDFRSRCRPALLVDPADLAARGGLAITEHRGRLMVARAVDTAGGRPWSGDLRRSDE